MNWWQVGFLLIAIGVGIPFVYGLYKFVLYPVEWYWRLSIICIILGCIVLLASAVKDRASSLPPEEKY